MAYSYKKSRDLNLMLGTCRLLSLDHHCGEDEALIQGQLQALFGEPAYTSSNMENAYGYFVIMENDDGARYVFHVYSGKSGPSISGNSRIEGIEDAALALKQYISEADPADFEYEGIYENELRIIMGVKNGVPYYSSFDIATGQIVEENGMGEILQFRKLCEEMGWICKREAKWEARAREKAREKDREEIARNALAEGVSMEIIQKITGLDMGAIEKLRGKREGE